MEALRTLPNDGGAATTELEAAAAEHSTIDRHFGWWLVLIASCGLALRVFVVVRLQHFWVGGDGFGYSLQANQFAKGHLFVDPYNPAIPTALHPPAWPTVIGTVALFGGHSWLSQQLVACTIGTLTVVAIGLAGRRIAGARVGLIGAGIGAVYAGLWMYERDLLSEVLLLLLIAVTLLVAYRFMDAPSVWLAAGLGVMVGLCSLTRSEEILIWPFLVVPLILSARTQSTRRRLGWLAIATTSMVIVLVPWTIYNIPRFQHLVVLSTGFGGSVAVANCDPAYYGPLTGYPSLSCTVLVKTTDESVASSTEVHHAETYAEHHLSRLPVVLIAREGRAFGYWNPFQQISLDSTAQDSPSWVNQLALYTYWLLLIPAIAGIVVMRRRGRPVYPLLAFVVIVIIAVAAIDGETRYRAAAEVPLVLLSAVGIEAGLRHATRSVRSGVEKVGRQAATGAEAGLATASATDSSLPEDTQPVTSGDFSHPALFWVAVVAVSALFIAGASAIVGAAVLNSPELAVHVVEPTDGATARSDQPLKATVNVTGQTKVRTVTFYVQGGSSNSTLALPATRRLTRWVATWDTSRTPDGTYQVACTAVPVNGFPVSSDTIRVVVKHS